MPLRSSKHAEQLTVGGELAGGGEEKSMIQHPMPRSGQQ